MQLRWDTFTFLYDKFTPDNMYQILSELVRFCRRCDKNITVCFFGSQCSNSAAPEWPDRSCSILISGGTDFPQWDAGCRRRSDAIRYRRPEPRGRLRLAAALPARQPSLQLRRRPPAEKPAPDGGSLRPSVPIPVRTTCTHNSNLCHIAHRPGISRVYLTVHFLYTLDYRYLK